MGRPINKKYIGNTSQTGQQIQATAYFGGDSQTRTAYINKQTSSNSYEMIDAGGTGNRGKVTLVPGGVSLLPGQANISVTPFGATGSSATATANLGINTTTITVAGTGTPATYYVPGEVLFPASGTGVKRANLVVSSVTLANVVVNGGSGPGYTVGDKFTWSGAGYNIPAIVTVASTTGNGVISTVTFTPGDVATTSITNATVYTSSTKANAWATGATFGLQWGISDLSVRDAGDYASAPANAVALSGSTFGTGAAVNVNWKVASVKVTAAGSGYQAAAVTFAGNAKGVGIVNPSGNLTSVLVTNPGSGYTNTNPTVTLAPAANVEYAAEIKNLTVTTFTSNSYAWVDSATTPVDGQAKLRTA